MLTKTRIAAVAAGALLVGGPAAVGAHGSTAAPCNTDWPAAWHDASHSSSVASTCTPISALTVGALAPRWIKRAGNVVSASPVVVGNTVYVGDWNGVFTAYNATTGDPRWHFQIRVSSPYYPGQIVSTATVTQFPDPSAAGGKRLAVIFGGGSSLWALDAATGHELASIDLDPRDAATKAAEAAAGENPQINVESSPAVADVNVNGTSDRRIYVGTDVHNDAHVGRTGLVALHLTRGAGGWSLDPIWKLDAETGAVYQGVAGLTANSGTGLGCGGVWSSPAVDVADGLVAFGSASCSNPEEAIANGTNYAERMVAARADTGQIAWSFRPAKSAAEAHLDDDFGSSANVFTGIGGERFVGEGRKSGCYYAFHAVTGTFAWKNCSAAPGHAGSNFAIGGYLGTPAVQTDSHGRALRIIGATAIPVPHPTDPRQVAQATTAIRAFDASNGKTLWTYRLAGPTYGSVSVANGIAFVADTTTSSLIMLDAARGVPLKVLPVAGPPSSTPAVVGSSVYITSGTSQDGIPVLDKTGGVYRFALPSVPALPAGGSSAS